MDNFPCYEIVSRDVDRCLVEIELVDNVMESPCSVYFLDRRNNLEIEGITESIKTPMDITCLKLQLIPSDMTKFYYNFLGLETIVYNLFKSNNKPFQDDLKKGDVYLKTYFKKDDFYTIPLLCLDIIFFRKLNSKTIDNLWKVLKSEIPLFTGDVGDIEQKVFYSKSSLNEYLKVPLLIGQPEFKQEGLLKSKKFSFEQILEMNHVHGITLIKLNMNEVINNKFLSLYDDIRDCITSSQEKDDYSEDEVEDVIKSIFSRDENDNLPF